MYIAAVNLSEYNSPELVTSKGNFIVFADPTKSSILQTDALERGLGAVLSQVDGRGEEHPVAFASRKLLPREINYSTIEECLATVWALKFLNTYLNGQLFAIKTDHQRLSWLHRIKKLKCMTDQMGLDRSAILVRD